jgi:hypothetical protein
LSALPVVIQGMNNPVNSAWLAIAIATAIIDTIDQIVAKMNNSSFYYKSIKHGAIYLSFKLMPLLFYQ